jgi:hypothetical protein
MPSNKHLYTEDFVAEHIIGCSLDELRSLGFAGPDSVTLPTGQIGYRPAAIEAFLDRLPVRVARPVEVPRRYLDDPAYKVDCPKCRRSSPTRAAVGSHTCEWCGSIFDVVLKADRQDGTQGRICDERP